jgi:enamine deaminase RidA (YjgF/YER057c/UK114 family)
MSGTIEQRLQALGITLPTPAAPVANYVPTLLDGDRLYISGQLPFVDGKLVATGRLGAGLDVEQGVAAARICGINILAQAKAALGDLERVRLLIKIQAFVASTPEFTQQPPVVNGCSNLLVDVLGDRGRHTRNAVGVAVLPLDSPLMIDAVIAFDP